MRVLVTGASGFVGHAACRELIARGLRSARTSNAKLKNDLGWAPRYPSAREGIPATVAALRAADK